MLYQKKKILHRDISPGNVLIESTSSTKALHPDFDDMCFSKYLLKGFTGQEDSDAEYVA
jgi:Ser/Thr protein kinase RdoA (MazF antagonist)